jgi:hypothetical protein
MMMSESQDIDQISLSTFVKGEFINFHIRGVGGRGHVRFSQTNSLNT